MSFFIEIAIVFIVSFAVTYVMVPVSKKIALRIGAIDYPGNRRINNVPIPRCGGIALFCGFIAGLIVVFVEARTCGHGVLDFIMQRELNIFLLILGIVMMFGVGLIDDVRQLNPKQKFAGQIVASCVVFASGVSISVVSNPFDGSLIPLGWLDCPITVLYLLVFVNITNLIDGLDGLAAGLVAIATMCLLVLVLGDGSFTMVAMCVALVAVCLAFLRYNFYPATVFMGDSGSLFLGLIVGIISIMGVARTASLVLMLIPLVIAGVPVVDTTSAIIRRLRAHKHIDEADMGHIHHRLVNQLGFSQRKAVLVLYACSAVLGIAGVAAGMIDGVGRYVVLVVMAVVVAAVIWKMGLFHPVLQHYYSNRGATGPRVPQGYQRGSGVPASDGHSGGEPPDKGE